MAEAIELNFPKGEKPTEEITNIVEETEYA